MTALPQTEPSPSIQYTVLWKHPTGRAFHTSLQLMPHDEPREDNAWVRRAAIAEGFHPITAKHLSQGEAMLLAVITGVDLQLARLPSALLTGALHDLAKFRSRKDLSPLPEFSEMNVDSDGIPCIWLNHYECEECGHKWQDAWSCQCDDECTCGISIEPTDSIALVNGALLALWDSLPEPNVFNAASQKLAQVKL